MDNKNIIEEIKKHLTGEKEIDVPYLQTELSIYKNMNNEEVIYAIANMLFQYLDPKIKEQLDLKTHEILDERRAEYEKVVNLLEQENYEQAKEILMNLVSIFQKATYAKEQNYYDFDQMIEYYIFCETVSNARKLKIRRYPEPVTYYMYQLSEIYLKENNISKAIEALEEALSFNPRCQYVLQTLAKLYFDNGKKEEAFQILKDSLLYAYTKEQMAYAYFMIGKYYEEKNCYDIAIVSYLSSTNYLPNPTCQERVVEITKKYGEICITSEKDINNIFNKYNLQFGISTLVINAINEFIQYTKKLNDYESAYYLINIAIELTDDEVYQKQLPEIEKVLEERIKWKKNQKF